MKQLHIGIIGLGGIAQVFHLPNLKKFNDVTITALCDSDEYKLLNVGKKHKVDRLYTDPTEMLKKEKLDGLLVLTSTNLHYPILSYAVKKNIPTFVERPPVRNLDEFQTLKKIMDKSKSFVQVGVNQRFDQDFILIKDFIEKKEIGDILYANLGWLQALKAKTKSPWFFDKNIAGGGVVLDLGFVLIDLLLWMLSMQKVKSVRAKLSKTKLNKDVEDFGAIFLNFEGGTSAVIEVSWDNVHPEDKFFMKFYGTKGYASYPNLKFFKQLHGRVLNLTPQNPRTTKSNMRITYINEMNYFINAIRGKAKPVAQLQEYEMVYKIIDAIYHSSQQDAEILL